MIAEERRQQIINSHSCSQDLLLLPLNSFALVGLVLGLLIFNPEKGDKEERVSKLYSSVGWQAGKLEI